MDKQKQIFKFQKGGLPFLSLKSNKLLQQGKPEKQETPNKDDDGLADIFSKLVGLPSDVSALQDSLQNITKDFRGNVSKSSAAYRYAVGKITTAAANKQLAEQAIGFVKANDSMREYAITNNGGIFVYKNTDDGRRQLTLISVKDFVPGKYLPAYISDLINERSNNPAYANNNELLTTIGDSIGRSVVFKKIMDIVKDIKFSSAETSEKKIVDGVQKLTGEDGEHEWANTLEVDAKGTQRMVNSEGKLVEDPNVNRAIRFIYNSLSDKEKVLLDLVGKDKGMSLGDVISDVVSTQSQLTTKSTRDFVKLGKGDGSGSGNGSGSGSGSGDPKGSTPITQAYLLQHDMGERSNTPLKLGSTIISTLSNGWLTRDVYANDKKIISGGSMKDVIFNSQIAPAINKNAIYFGGKKLSTADLECIAYRPNGFKSMYLPYIKDNQNNLSIDFASWKKVEKAEKMIRDRKIKKDGSEASNKLIQSIYEANGAGSLINYAYANESNPGVSEKQQTAGRDKLQKFVFFEGIAAQKILDKYGSGSIAASPFADVYKLAGQKNDPVGNRIITEYSRLMQNGHETDKDSKLTDIVKDAKNVEGGWFSTDSDMVESLVYASVNRDFENAGIATENIVTKKETPSDKKTNSTFTQSGTTQLQF